MIKPVSRNQLAVAVGDVIQLLLQLKPNKLKINYVSIQNLVNFPSKYNMIPPNPFHAAMNLLLSI